MAVAYTEELLSRVQAWLGLPLTDKRSAAGLTELAAVYSAVSGQPTGSCRQCQYSDYAAVLRAYERQSLRLLHPELMADSQYTLAPGFENEQLVHESYPEVLTADTISDKGAEFFIEQGYKHAFLKNGKPIADEPAKEEGKPLTEKQQLQATYAELHGQAADEKLTIIQLKEANAAKQAELDKQD